MAAERRESEVLTEEERREARERHLLRAQQSQLRRIAQVVRFADFMAILMVVATAFSAYATWKTAQVTARIFAVSDRPFIGVQSVAFEQTNTEMSAVVVDFRNFGHIPAGGALIHVRALVDGRAIKPHGGEMAMAEQGNVSPGVPHFFNAYVKSDDYQKIVSGKARLMVDVRIEYKDPDMVARYCYFEKIIYDYRSASFRHAGGTDKCDNSDVF